MRPQQQNRRMRGRGNNNNRKGPNPLTRSYESNGPDVKIRGTAQQVADKYTTLARDAQSSGDRVMAENYLQHAEHYNRIIAAAMAQQQQFQQQRDGSDDFDDEDDDRADRDGRAGEPQPRPQQVHQPYSANGFGPQPVIDSVPTEPGYQAAASGEQRAERSPGSDDNGGEPRQAAAEDGAPRRPRRPRRPRGRADQGAESAGAEAVADRAEAPQTPEAAE